MLPQHLIAMLEATPGFQELSVDAGKNDTLQSASIKLLDKFCTVIRQEVLQRVEKDDSLRPLVTKNVLGGTTLQRWLKKDKSMKDRRAKETIHALLIYLDISRDKWEQYLHGDLDYAEAMDIRLLGSWYIYRYHRDHLMRTLIKISMGPGQRLTARYKSIYDTVFDEGEVIRHQNSLTLRFNKHGKTIDIAAYSSDNIMNRPKPLFNGIIRSIEDVPYATRCILAYESGDMSKEMKQSATEIVHSTEIVPPGGFSDELIDPIVVYLRKEYRRQNELSAIAFAEPTFNGMTAANEATLNRFYDNYREILTNDWYSFSLTPSGLRRKTWTFKPDEVLKTGTVTSREGDLTLEGTVTYSQNQVFLQVSAGDQSFMQVILKSLEKTIRNGNLIALTSEVDGQAMGAYREVFVKKMVAGPDEAAPVSYQDFLTWPGLEDWEKRFLIKQDPIAFPGLRENLVGEAAALKQFANKYLAFIPNFYSANKEEISLLQITLDIDSLGRVQEQVCLDVSGPPASWRPTQYIGEASLLDHTLRLTNINAQNKKRSDYLFITSSVHSWFLQGVTQDTDSEGDFCSDAVVAIQIDKFPEGYSFEPGVIDQRMNAYTDLDAMLKVCAGMSIEEYFFKAFISIRRRNNTLHQHSM